jgi:UDP-N-acetyl-D-mannosaminuronate dehydrogenase
MVHLTVGMGDVGKAIQAIFDGPYVTKTVSVWNGKPVDVAHICIPYITKKDFFTNVENYKNLSKLVIVHSTTPVGTCDALGVVHSPIRGVHPHLNRGLWTFVKYFGGKNAGKAARIFSAIGIQTRVFKEAKTTEAIKLWDTTQYGKLIMMEKEIYEWCKKNNLDYREVYQIPNQDYNRGYVALGRPDVVRPWLKHVPGPIGGHCVLPNAKLLGVKL